MKRKISRAILSLTLAAAILGCQSFVFATEPENTNQYRVNSEIPGASTEKKGMFGDVNTDGETNVVDALLALQISAKIIEQPSAEMKAAANVDGDTRVTVKDALKILRMSVRLEKTEWPFAVNTMFKNRAVLQREAKVPVWGTGQPGQKVTVTFHGQSVSSTIDEAGNWIVYLNEMEATNTGEDLTITTDSPDAEPIVLENVLVGEVWLASGQSNMAFIVNYLKNPTYDDILNDCSYPNIRVYVQAEKMSGSPYAEAKGTWNTAAPNFVGNFSTMGFLLARGLHKALNVPVGIITAAYGGTSVEAWIDPDILSDSNLPVWGGGYEKKNCYYANTLPTMPYAIRGMIWYQGENNSGLSQGDYHQYYDDYLKLMIEQNRAGYKNPDMPVINIQLPSYAPPESYSDANFLSIREAQMNAEKIVNNLYTVITYDTGDKYDIHPFDKLPIGERMTAVALNKVYGKTDIADASPVFKEASVDGNKVLVTFDNVYDGISLQEGKRNITTWTEEYIEQYWPSFIGMPLEEDLAKGFQLCGADGEYYDATATVIGTNQVEVTCEEVANPVGIRYAWKNCMLNCDRIVGSNGFPAAPFSVILAQ